MGKNRKSNPAAIDERALKRLLSQARRELERQSSRDPLTGLANARCFANVLAREWSRALRLRHTLSLLRIGSGGFPPFVRRVGAAAGDDWLRRLATALKRAVGRITDLAARTDPAEFTVLLPETDGGGARIVAERILAEARAAAPELPLRIGISTLLPRLNIEPDVLMRQAGFALAQAMASAADPIAVAEADMDAAEGGR